MEQFEELMVASAAVSPASRPITLYYAVVQAGLAIAAARKSDPWSFGRHGLKLLNPQSPISEIIVAPEGLGAFQMVSEATNSSALEEPANFGALWASLPDWEGVPLPGSLAHTTLPVLKGGSWPDDDEVYPEKAVVSTVFIPDEAPGEEAFKAVLGDLLRNYPGTSGCTIVDESYREVGRRRWSAEIIWRSGREFEEYAPAYRYTDDFFVRPSVGGVARRPPSIFMTWWAILYSFSILSRYHPRQWAGALDIDRSPLAHLLEYALDHALDIIPHLVMDALDGEQTLFAKPVQL